MLTDETTRKTRHREYQQRYRARHPDRVRATEKKRVRTPEQIRKYRLKTFYNLTLAQVEEIRAAQNNSCKLCLKSFTTMKSGSVHIDHCHETGRVRGLLCIRCNSAIGALGDNPAGLERALNYVRGTLP